MKHTWQESLIQYFAQGEKAEATPRLGVEVEHFILDRSSQRAVPYSGDKGVRKLLSLFMEQYPDASILPDDDFFGFRVPEFTITLEPAAQFEISIAPMDSIRRIGRVYRDFSKTLEMVLRGFGYTAACVGCQPVSRIAETEQIPKRRYDLMRAHFQKTGTGGMEMMRGTASLQVSIDYRSEEDFRKKLQAAYYYMPVLKLLCDNSPSFQGSTLSTFLKRTDIWRRVDPARCGILPDVFSESYGYADYARFLGDMAPIFIQSDQGVQPTGDRTVSDAFAEKDMREAEMTHVLSMAFPDVRLKRYLEIRFADSVPLPFVLSYCAVMQGLLYSEEGTAFAQEQIRSGCFSTETVYLAEDALMQHGWNASVYGRSAGEMAKTVLDLARCNLPEQDQTFLDAFYTVVSYGGIRNLPTDVYRTLEEAVERALKKKE